MNASQMVEFIIYTLSRPNNSRSLIDDHRPPGDHRVGEPILTQSQPSDLSPVLIVDDQAQPTPAISFGLKSYWYRGRAIAKCVTPPADLINFHGVRRVALQGLPTTRGYEHQVNAIANDEARSPTELSAVLQPASQSISERRYERSRFYRLLTLRGVVTCNFNSVAIFN